MTRIETIRKSGYTIRFFDAAGKMTFSFDHIRYYYINNNFAILENIDGLIVADNINMVNNPVFMLEVKKLMGEKK